MVKFKNVLKLKVKIKIVLVIIIRHWMSLWFTNSWNFNFNCRFGFLIELTPHRPSIWNTKKWKMWNFVFQSITRVKVKNNLIITNYLNEKKCSNWKRINCWNRLWRFREKNLKTNLMLFSALHVFANSTLVYSQESFFFLKSTLLFLFKVKIIPKMRCRVKRKKVE